jgi:hypothetical protein
LAVCLCVNECNVFINIQHLRMLPMLL